MDAFDKVRNQSSELNEKYRNFKGKKTPRKLLNNKAIIESIMNEKLNSLKSDDVNIVELALYNISQCFRIDPTSASLIDESFISLLIENISSCKPDMISSIFYFLTCFVRIDRSKIPYLIESGILQFAISKIPIDSVCDFIVELLIFSESLNEDDDFNVFPFFFENDLRRKLLNVLDQLINYEYEQSQILKILMFLWKNQEDFTQEELNLFIKDSNRYLMRVDDSSGNRGPQCSFDEKKNSQCFITYLNFLIRINSHVFYSFLTNLEDEENAENRSAFKLFEIIWKKLKENDSDVCFACINFLTSILNYDAKCVNYLFEIDISDHMSDLLENTKIKDDVKVSGALMVERIIGLNLDACIRFVDSNYITVIEKFVNSCYINDQYIAIHFISALMAYSTDTTISNLLVSFDLTEKIIDFLNADNHVIVCDLLSAINSNWEIAKTSGIGNEFIGSIVDLKHNEDFISALDYIVTEDNKQASELAQLLLDSIHNDNDDDDE